MQAKHVLVGPTSFDRVWDEDALVAEVDRSEPTSLGEAARRWRRSGSADRVAPTMKRRP